jgi:hypothetical protein
MRHRARSVPRRPAFAENRDTDAQRQQAAYIRQGALNIWQWRPGTANLRSAWVMLDLRVMPRRADRDGFAAATQSARSSATFGDGLSEPGHLGNARSSSASVRWVRTSSARASPNSSKIASALRQ